MRKLLCFVVLFVVACYFTTVLAGEGGRLIKSGSTTLSLVTLQADADSNIYLDPVDLTGTKKVPAWIVGKLAISGAVGGTATATATGLTVIAYAMPTYDDDMTDLITYTDAVVPLGSWSILPASSGKTFATAANTAGWIPFVAGAITAATIETFAVVPRWVVFRVSKTGNGTYTAGTLTISWDAYEN